MHAKQDAAEVSGQTLTDDLCETEIANLPRCHTGDSAVLLLSLHDEDVCRLEIRGAESFIMGRFHAALICLSKSCARCTEMVPSRRSS